jgi:hypothetical protein
VKKELFEKKGSVSWPRQPLYPGRAHEVVLQHAIDRNQPGFVSNDVRNFYRRAVRLSFNYQFGKMDFDAKPRRKKSITNDDAKARWTTINPDQVCFISTATDEQVAYGFLVMGLPASSRNKRRLSVGLRPEWRWRFFFFLVLFVLLEFNFLTPRRAYGL